MFLLDALLAGWILSLVSGPLGSFLVWRRMAYFGDTLAHSALLGITFGLLLDINLNLAVVLCAVMLALILLALQKQQFIPSDTLLGIMAHTSLATGLVALALVGNVRIDLNGYLFGDLLAVERRDVYLLAGAAALMLALILRYWRGLLAITVNEELARVEGYPVERLRLLLMVLVALLIAGAMKIVGVLLITALLIIPAASARAWANSPARMALHASLLSMLSVLLGLSGSYWLDTPAGASIVVVAALLFVFSQLSARLVPSAMQ
ncbi:MAG: metal ABC transporter permease [Oceanospirillaceae bacterium]|nr:metal ABC transporter permease [Oceanospirillaceae bacterium]MCP5351337.1 metal ABC transporter permease [Oceanospirillaceae bacterium]